jgi:hypothetical protein
MNFLIVHRGLEKKQRVVTQDGELLFLLNILVNNNNYY